MRTLRATATFSDSSVVLVQETEPKNPALNTVWIDTKGNAKRWNGSEWVNITDGAGYVKEEYLREEFFKQETTRQGIEQIIGKTEIWIGGEEDGKNVALIEAINSVTQTATETKSLISGFSLNSNAKVFTTKPAPPYSKNDLWYDTSSTNQRTKMCVKSRSSGYFTESDWETVEDNIAQRAYMAFSIADQTKDKIEWMVSGDTSSSMTLTDDMLEVVAEKINLRGNAVFKSLTDETDGVTTIDGSKIKAGTISADVIDAEELFSKNITMTGTLTSYYDDNTTHLTIGNGKLVMNSKSRGFCGIEIKREKLEEDCYGDFFTATNIRSDFIDITHMGTYERIAIGRVIDKDNIEKGFGMYYIGSNNKCGFELWATQEDEKCNMYLSGDSQIGGTLTVNGDVKIGGIIKGDVTTVEGVLKVNKMSIFNNTINVLNGGGLSVNGDTTLDSTLTVEGITTLKDKIVFENNHNYYKTEINDFGITSKLPNYYSSKTEYSAYGMRIYNRTGALVGQFQHYNDCWSALLQTEYIKATYEIQCGKRFRFKNSNSDSGYLEISVNDRDSVTDFAATPFPYLIFKQYSNALDIYPSIMDSSKSHGCYLGNVIPFLEIKANNFYNSAGTSISSDRKVKKDILDIDDNFVNSLIDSISAKTYKYINGSSNRTHYGAIAQDIEDIIVGMGLTTQDFGGIVKNYKTIEVEKEDGSSELETDYESEPDYYLRYDEFIMPLVRYCQLLKKRVETLENVNLNKSETETLRKENEELREELKELREMVTSLVNKEE